MKRLFKHFTTDTRPCGCSRHSTAPKCDRCAPKPKANRVSNATTDERKPVDLNEIHRRFWAKLAGKE
jgi:hypothetical protein